MKPNETSKQRVVRRQCAELVDTHPKTLGKYAAQSTHPCRNKATVETRRGWMCKFHAKRNGLI